MDIHPSNDLHTCKMEHENDSESEIIPLVKYIFKLYDLQAGYPRNNMHTSKMKHEDEE